MADLGGKLTAEEAKSTKLAEEKKGLESAVEAKENQIRRLQDEMAQQGEQIARQGKERNERMEECVGAVNEQLGGEEDKVSWNQWSGPRPKSKPYEAKIQNLILYTLVYRVSTMKLHTLNVNTI